MMDSGLSVADAIALRDDGARSNNGFGDGNGWWVMFLFFLLAYGGNGWGGFGNGGANGMSGILTRSDLCQDMNFSDLEAGVRSLQSGLCDGFYAQNTTMLNGFNGLNNTIQSGFAGVDNAICNLGFNMQQGFNTTNVALMQGQNALQSQIADCCCTTQRAIDSVNYNMATNTCAITNQMNNNTRDIIDSQNAGTRAILDYLCQDKISTLQSENQSLKLAASQEKQNNYLVNTLRPCPTPAFITCNPYTGGYGDYGYNGFNNGGCGCNNGCGC